MKRITDSKIKQEVSKLFGEGINKGNVLSLCIKLLDDQMGRAANTTTITLRDKFASEAMGALLSRESVTDVHWVTTRAYSFADAMLEERIKH